MSAVHSTRPPDLDQSLIGIAGEHVVCADLALQGYRAFRVDGLPYDILADCGGRVIRIQIKTTLSPRLQKRTRAKIPAYLWYVRWCGTACKSSYRPGDFDLLALAALDIRRVAYMPPVFGAASIHIRQPGVASRPDARSRQFDDFSLERALLLV